MALKFPKFGHADIHMHYAGHHIVAWTGEIQRFPYHDEHKLVVLAFYLRITWSKMWYCENYFVQHCPCVSWSKWSERREKKSEQIVLGWFMASLHYHSLYCLTIYFARKWKKKLCVFLQSFASKNQFPILKGRRPQW